MWTRSVKIPDRTARLTKPGGALQLVLAAKESVEVGRPVKVSQMSHDRI